MKAVPIVPIVPLGPYPLEIPPIGTIGAIGTGRESDVKHAQAVLFDRRAEQVDGFEQRAAIVEDGAGMPRRWAEGYAALCSMVAPPGFSRERWRRIVDAAGNFLDRWAAKAIECDWSDLDLFGCDPTRPDARFDCMGLLLLLDRWEIMGIDEGGADLVIQGEPQRYRRRPLPANTISLWELARR